ncbi:hypothetical protein [Herbidospora sp. NBRC 101105]|uniref:hypothetical protein n=1 Tax=Herbidospora sp. NBRC 101105 TaxID=3032195 RepID=UPI0024A574FC|nr:hypothetical protein [Herbidospora sp. NBRC 101105]GLX98276.1 hypothetical protein Hesp01_62260 [Herbidospora sp. NBRC 101105]
MKTARLILVAGATSLLMGVAACSGGTTEVCNEAMKAFTDYSTKVGQAAGNLDGINSETQALATQLKGLADKADGDLKSSLTKMADTWATLKIDPANPSAVTEFATKTSEATQELAVACGG